MSENSVKTFGKDFSDETEPNYVEFVFFGKTFRIKERISGAHLMNIQVKIAELLQSPNENASVSDLYIVAAKKKYVEYSFESKEKAKEFFEFMESVDEVTIEHFDDVFQWIVEQHTSRPTK